VTNLRSLSLYNINAPQSILLLSIDNKAKLAQFHDTLRVVIDVASTVPDVVRYTPEVHFPQLWWSRFLLRWDIDESRHRHQLGHAAMPVHTDVENSRAERKR
jgi:hypothetical protein